MKISMKDFFSKCDQFLSFPKKSSMENLIFVQYEVWISLHKFKSCYHFHVDFT